MSQFDDTPRARSGAATISAESFVATLAANVENGAMNAEAFRQFVRNTLPIVDFPGNKGQSASRSSSSQFDGDYPTR